MQDGLTHIVADFVASLRCPDLNHASWWMAQGAYTNCSAAAILHRIDLLMRPNVNIQRDVVQPPVLMTWPQVPTSLPAVYESELRVHLTGFPRTCAAGGLRHWVPQARGWKGGVLQDQGRTKRGPGCNIRGGDRDIRGGWLQ
jgi:hypothetical protein